MTPTPPTTFEDALKALIEQMKISGHIVEAATWGKFRGLRCARCGDFHSDSEFGKWRKKCVPKPISRQLIQHQQRRKTAAQRTNMEEHVKRAKVESAKMDTETKSYPQDLKTPNEEDEEDMADMNEGRPVKRYKGGEGWRTEPNPPDMDAAVEEPAAKAARKEGEQEDSNEGSEEAEEARQGAAKDITITLAARQLNQASKKRHTSEV